MQFEIINKICPNCNNGNYMRFMTGNNVGEFNVKCLNCNHYFKYDDLVENNSEEKNEEPNLVAADLWFSDGTADTLTQIETCDMTDDGCHKGCVNLSIKNAKLHPFIKYQDTSEIAYTKLRDVNTCLKTLCFMLEQYSLPDEENNVTKFDSTQDMAKYFKLMADMCLKISEFD